MNNPKRTIAVLSVLLALAVGWIVRKQIEDARQTARAREDTDEMLRRAARFSDAGTP